MKPYQDPSPLYEDKKTEKRDIVNIQYAMIVDQLCIFSIMDHTIKT